MLRRTLALLRCPPDCHPLAMLDHRAPRWDRVVHQAMVASPSIMWIRGMFRRLMCKTQIIETRRLFSRESTEPPRWRLPIMARARDFHNRLPKIVTVKAQAIKSKWILRFKAWSRLISQSLQDLKEGILDRQIWWSLYWETSRMMLFFHSLTRAIQKT